MVWRSIFIIVLALITSAAYALEGGGGGLKGTNFTCGDTKCVCDGSYTDCKNMETNICIDKLDCSKRTTCTCTYKAQTAPQPQKKVPGTLLPKGTIQRN